MLPDAALDRFADELAEPAIDLGRAALVMGQFARADLEVDRYLEQLDEMAETARARGLDEVATIGALFGEDALIGNEAEYYDPRNSLLAEVLDRRLGIPISLSVVAIEVGRRLGIAVEGVPFPGHFLIRVRGPGRSALLDPFSAGQPISDEELLLRLRAATGRIGALGPEQLGAASTRTILARMLQNLKVIYLKAEDFELGLAVQDRLCVVRADELRERRDRGLIYARLGQDVGAEADLSAYLEGERDPEDAKAVRSVLEQVRGRRGPAN